jgi:hypothetical protein
MWLLLSCGAESEETATDSGDPESAQTQTIALEIIPGVGIGPVTLGMTYGELRSVYGEPDALIDYNRVFLATWMELGVEVVMGSGLDDSIEESARVVSVGTKLPLDFSGDVVPGMTRAEGDAILGTCTDVIDDTHCYHEAGLYLGYDESGVIRTIAVHPLYTFRAAPPEMTAAQGFGGVQ